MPAFQVPYPNLPFSTKHWLLSTGLAHPKMEKTGICVYVLSGRACMANRKARTTCENCKLICLVTCYQFFTLAITHSKPKECPLSYTGLLSRFALPLHLGGGGGVPDFRFLVD